MNYPSFLKTVFLVFVATGIFAFSLPASADNPNPSENICRSEGPCKYNSLTLGEMVWFQEANFQILPPVPCGSPKYRTYKAQSLSDPRRCFMLDNYGTGKIYNSDAPRHNLMRTLGYQYAIEHWMQTYSLNDHPANWPEGMTVRKRLKGLTSISFLNLEELKLWWKENKHYAIWSDEANHLVIDQAAKKAQNPFKLIPVDDTLQPYYDPANVEGNRSSSGPGTNDTSSGYRFWLSHASMPEAWVAWRSGPHMQTIVVVNHVYLLVNISLETYENRPIKQKAFLRALEVLIRGMTDFDKSKYPKRAVFYIYPLKKLTGLNFETPKEWIVWFKNSKNNLTLSADGERLTIKNK